VIRYILGSMALRARKCIFGDSQKNHGPYRAARRRAAHAASQASENLSGSGFGEREVELFVPQTLGVWDKSRAPGSLKINPPQHEA
jgi:hypothetical protein